MKIYFIMLINLMIFGVSSLHGMQDEPKLKPNSSSEWKSMVRVERECREQLELCIKALSLKEIPWTQEKKPGRCYPILSQCLLLLEPSKQEDPDLHEKYLKILRHQENMVLNKRVNLKDELSPYFDNFTIDLMDGGEILEISQGISYINLSLKRYQNHQTTALKCVTEVNILLGEIMKMITNVYERKDKNLNVHAYFPLITRMISSYVHLIKQEFNLTFNDSSALLKEVSAFVSSLKQTDESDFLHYSSVLPILEKSCAADYLQWLSWELAKMIDNKRKDNQEKLTLLYNIQENARVYCSQGKQVTFFLNSLMQLVQQALEIKYIG